MLKLRPIGLVFLTFLLVTVNAPAQTVAAPTAIRTTGKNPVIIIPGISGSQLINSKTGKSVWFSIKRDKDDDLRLPMTSPVLSRNRDGLRAS